MTTAIPVWEAQFLLGFYLDLTELMGQGVLPSALPYPSFPCHVLSVQLLSRLLLYH